MSILYSRFHVLVDIDLPMMSNKQLSFLASKLEDEMRKRDMIAPREVSDYRPHLLPENQQPFRDTQVTIEEPPNDGRFYEEPLNVPLGGISMFDDLDAYDDIYLSPFDW